LTELLFRDDAYLRECQARVTAVGADPAKPWVELDRTVFYYESGGQPGDVGQLTLVDGRAATVVDARRGEQPGSVRHLLAAPLAGLAPGAPVVAAIDWARRHRLMRMHTCLHLLSAIIVAPVTGGQVGDGYGRLDFDLPDNIDAADVEQRLNALIARDDAVGTRWISEAELDAHPELVKTMSVAPPRGLGAVRLVEVAGVDLQPCGGTHVARTRELGPMRIAKVEKKGAHNRRVRIELAATAASA
jgi:misacylated tRNA(Ala) deacylase